MVDCASCGVAMTHTYAQKEGKPLYRYYVCGKAHRQGWEACETRSVSAPALEQAVVGQLGAMAADDTDPNEVRVALDREAINWAQLTGERQLRFIRTLVKRVRYDGRTGNVTVQFDPAAFPATTEIEALNRIEGETNGNRRQ